MTAETLPPRSTVATPLVGSLDATEAPDIAEFEGRLGIPPIKRLVRVVKALPLDKFMPLNDAFAKAKNCLGSRDLAAHDLTQHARNKRLTVGARQIFSDGTEQVLIFRRAFWRSFAICPPGPGSEVVKVLGPTILPGAWYCVVGRRRFGRLYPTAIPSVSAAPAALPPPRLVSAVDWITGEARRLKQDNKIPAGINKTAFAKMLAANMEKAAKTDHSISIKPVGPGYILNQLEGWSLWPISSIK